MECYECTEVKNGEEEEECCGICGDNYNNQISYKLKCNHVFHYDCLIKTFLVAGKHNNSCPYCRQKTGYLSVPEGRTPIKKINPPQLCKTGGYKCTATLKSGKRCGLACGSNVVQGFSYCKRHLKQ